MLRTASIQSRAEHLETQYQEEIMWNLEDVHSGTECQIVWLLGDTGRWLKKLFHFDEEDWITVIRNDGESVIIDHNHHRYALGNEAAHAIKVVQP